MTISVPAETVLKEIGRISMNRSSEWVQVADIADRLGFEAEVVRSAIDEARKRAGQPVGDDSRLRQLPQPVSADERIDREKRALGVMAVLGQLPERQRQVVELHYFDRLRDAEISQRLGGSVAAIRVLRCRALKELRRLMEANDATR